MKQRPLFGDTVDVRRLVAHHAEVADDEDVWFVGLGFRLSGASHKRRSGSDKDQQEKKP